MDLHFSRLPALNGLALCAGYGGLELGLHIAEPLYRTVCFVEREAHAAATLVARMEDEALDHAPIWDDVKSFDGRPWRGRIHILTAGYPCQPFTSSGRRKGAADPRHLWPDVERIIGEAQPEWVFAENVLGHLDLGFPEVAGGLQRMGYHVKAGLFSAAEAGASHWRQRLFVLAHADGLHIRKSSGVPGRSQGARRRATAGADGLTGRAEGVRSKLGASMASVPSGGAETDREAADDVSLFAPPPGDFDAWYENLARNPDLEPAIWGVADGMAERLDELRGAGNGVCSLAAALAFRTLRADFGF